LFKIKGIKLKSSFFGESITLKTSSKLLLSDTAQKNKYYEIISKNEKSSKLLIRKYLKY